MAVHSALLRFDRGHGRHGSWSGVERRGGRRHASGGPDASMLPTTRRGFALAARHAPSCDVQGRCTGRPAGRRFGASRARRLSKESPFPSEARRSLKTQQHAHLDRSLGRVCVQVRPAARSRLGGRRAVPEVTPSCIRGAHGVPGAPHVDVTALVSTVRGFDALCEQFFTESLILAQDERWRRA